MESGFLPARSGAAKDPAGQQSNPTSAPTVNVPKGGGALRRMGEKFAVNPVTGTGSVTVPTSTSPGRAGFRSPHAPVSAPAPSEQPVPGLAVRI